MFKIRVAFAFIIYGMTGAALAVTAGHIDDFEDATTQDWEEGAGQGTPNPNPPSNIASGGPLGAGDNYLENISTGGIGSGSKQLIFNSGANWTGDFLAAEINLVQMDVRVDPGSEGPVDLRLAVEGAGGARFASTDSETIPADGTWYTVVFSLTAAEMTKLIGVDSFDQTMNAVSVVRIVHAPSSPNWAGEAFDGAVGFDNIASLSVSQFTGWIYETGVANLPSIPELEEESCFGPISLAVDSDDNWRVIGTDACISRLTNNLHPARSFFNYDPVTDTIGFVESFEARSTEPLLSAGGNLLELIGEDVEMGVGQGGSRLATILAEPSDSDFLIAGGYESFSDQSYVQSSDFVDVFVKDSPDSRAARTASDLQGTWYISFFNRFISRSNVESNVAGTGLRVLNLQAAGVCTFEEPTVFHEAEAVNNGDHYSTVQIAMGGSTNLSDRGVASRVALRTRSICSYQIDGDGYLSVDFTVTNNTVAPPIVVVVNQKYVVSDDDNYLVYAPDPDGVEEYPFSLAYGYRAPSEISTTGIDGDYLFYLSVTDYEASGSGHSGQSTGSQVFNLHGRGRISFDSSTPGTVPSGQAGDWDSCDLEFVSNEIEYRADGDQTIGQVSTFAELQSGGQAIPNCSYNLAADGGLLMNLVISEPGEPDEEVLFSGYVNDNGEVLTLVDLFTDIENPGSPVGTLVDLGSVRHIVAMQYTGDLAANEDGDRYSNLEEFQLPLPPPLSSVFGDITTFSDATSDDLSDIAGFADEEEGRPIINVYSGGDGNLHFSHPYINSGWYSVALSTVNDGDQDGSSGDTAVSMLVVNKTTNRIRVETREVGSGGFFNSIQFFNEKWRAVDVVVVDDLNGDGVPNDTAIGVLAERFSDGRIQLQLRSYSSGALISNTVYLNARWTPIAAAVAVRSGLAPAGTLPPVIGVIAHNTENNKRTMQSRVAGSGAFDQNIKFLGSAWDYLDVSVNHDANGDGDPADPVWVVLAERTSDDVIRVQSRFVADGSFDDNIVILNSNWEAHRLDVAYDISGNDAGEMVISATRRADGVRRIHVKDFGTGATTINIAP